MKASNDGMISFDNLYLDANNQMENMPVTRRDFKISPSPSKTLAGHSNRVWQVRFLPRGRLASCSSDKTIKIWDILSGKELFQLTGHTDSVYSLAMLSCGWLASVSADKTIKLWDLDQQQEVRTFEADFPATSPRPATSLKILENGHLVSYSEDDTLRIWNPMSNESNPRLTIKGNGIKSWPTLFGVLANDSRQRIVTCYHDSRGQGQSMVIVHDSIDGKVIKSISVGKDKASSLLVLPNAQVVFGFENGSIKIFDPMKGSKSGSIDRAHDSDVTSLFQFSNGNLVSSGEDGTGTDKKITIKVWNLADLSFPLQIVDTGYAQSIYSIAACQDETLLATASWDKDIKIWSIS